MSVDKSRIGGLWLVYGIPGTGKTLLGGIADGVLPAIEHGRTVYTNITGLSVCGLASLADVPPCCVDVRILETIQDIVNAFDSEDCKNALFVLDEMKQVLARDKQANDWLCQRLNIMRKRSNDFIMIAQVPTYFSSEVRELAKGCTLYKRMYAFGSKTRTREYRFDGGDPVVERGRLSPAAYKVRKLRPELFTVYQSGIDGLIGVEDNGRANSVWTSPKAIVGYLAAFFFLALIVFGVFMFFSIKDSVGALGDSIAGRGSAVSIVDSVHSKKAVQYEDRQETELCFSRKICDSIVCKTNAGDFPAASWSDVVGGFIGPSGVVYRCP